MTADEGVVIAVPGQDITLSFNRQDTHINDYLLEPSWTFQGNDIDATQPRYAVSSDGLSLTITNVALTDYGIYSFQYNGLNLQAHNEFCEQMTLSLLRDYPVFSTGYIILTSSGGYILYKILVVCDYNYKSLLQMHCLMLKTVTIY